MGKVVDRKSNDNGDYYNLTFTAGALLMNETCAVAEVYLEIWSQNTNVFTKRNGKMPKQSYVRNTTQKNIIKSLFNFGDQSQFKNNYKNDEQFARCFPFMDYQFNLLQASIIELSKNNAFSGKQQSVGERSMLTITQEYVHVLHATCQPTLCCVRWRQVFGKRFGNVQEGW